MNPRVRDVPIEEPNKDKICPNCGNIAEFEFGTGSLRGSPYEDDERADAVEFYECGCGACPPRLINEGGDGVFVPEYLERRDA